MKAESRIAVLDLDLEELPEAVPGLDEYSEAWVLLRFRGNAVGKIMLPVEGGEVRPREHRQAIVAAGGYELKARVLDGWLGAGASGAGRPPGPGGPPRPGPATVAIPTRERPNDLRVCLTAVAPLLAQGHEILVVDNCPATTATIDVVTEFPGVRYVKEDRKGLNVARNRALREAGRGIVAFTDDDAVPDPGWLPAILAGFEHRLTLCVTGLTVPLELETRAQQLHEQHSTFSRGFRRKTFDGTRFSPVASGHAGAGVNMAFRTEVLDLVGPFDEALDAGTPTHSGGDNEMFSRVLAAGYRIAYEPGAMSRHRHRRTMEELRRAFFGYGVGVYAAWTRALFLEGETGVFGIAGSWLLKRQLPDLGRGLLGRKTAPPLSLQLAQLAGCFLGPWAYLRSRWKVDRPPGSPVEVGP